MNYRVFILPSAQKELERLPRGDYQRVRDVVLALAKNPRPPGCAKLRNREAWRVRQGDYRILYEIDDEQTSVTVASIGHRRDVYG